MESPRRAGRRSLSVGDLRMGARFLRRLPAVLRRPWRLPQARQVLRERFENRTSRFLAAAKRLIYKNPSSPYRALLASARCSFEDLERLVGREGIEGALRALYRSGVYLTVEEFKGRRPVVRGTAALNVDPQALRNPLGRSHLALKSGGSRSRGTPVHFDLDFINDCALDTGLALDGRGGLDWQKATWEVPGGGALFSLLEFSQFGARPVRWFSQLDPERDGLPARYRWSGRAFRWGSLLAGVSLPGPQYVSLEDAEPIARWMAETVAEGGTPYLLTYPSSALRVCQSAARAGLDLSGARMTIAGEPCTRARLEAIRRTGADVLPKYAAMETGPIGYGCLDPRAPDDIHLLSDLLAVIRVEDEAASGPLLPGSILFTSLMPTAPFVLFNVSMGDQARLEERSCGCPLERLGWTVHLDTIRSSEKLTCGGMNFMDSSIIRVLDEVMPARFGGGPTDYQILEEEDENGEPVLRLLIRPGLGPVDEAEVARTFLAEIGRGGGAEAVMGLAWRDGKILRLERRDPLRTPSGKILHLHVKHSP